jgi:hypothetical protein
MVTQAPQQVQGPAEDYDAAWRTTNSHTPKQMMSVFRELFFAGLPKPTPRRGQQADDDEGTSEASNSSLVTFPPALVQEMFSRFGPVTSFHFDVTRGVGAVTFENGEDAERCYVTAHLSLMRGVNAPNHGVSEKSGHRSGLGNMFGKHAALLYLEFAQWLPFVNPLLLDRNVAALTTMNRQLLRTFPVCTRRESPSTWQHVVYSCKYGCIERNGDKISLPGHGTMSDLSLAVAIVQTIFPVGSGKEHDVTVLDLWAQYFDQFVLCKTQPDAQRIAFPEFRFAAKASAVQDIVQYCRQAAERGGADGRVQLTRFAEDDVLHSTMAYLVFKTRMVHDPTYVSFLRAVDTKYAKITSSTNGASADGGRKSSAFGTLRRPFDLPVDQPSTVSGGSQDNNSGKDDPETILINLSLVEAAANLIENAQFMYSSSTTNSTDEEDVRFDHVLKLFDEFASSGNASTVASICCSRESFRGPNGLPHNLPTMRGMLWRTFKIPIYFTAVLLLVLFAVMWSASSSPKKQN